VTHTWFALTGEAADHSSLERCLPHRSGLVVRVTLRVVGEVSGMAGRRQRGVQLGQAVVDILLHCVKHPMRQLCTEISQCLGEVEQPEVGVMGPAHAVSEDTGVPGGRSVLPGGDVGTLAGVGLVQDVLESLDACAVVVVGVLRQPGPLRV
jgi:hypothetical protein